MSVQGIECFLLVLMILTPLADRRIAYFRTDGDAPLSPIIFQEMLARENTSCSPVSLPADPAPRLRDPQERVSTETYRTAADPTTTGDTTRQRHHDRTPIPFEKKGECIVGPNPPLSSAKKMATSKDRTSAPKEDDTLLTGEKKRGAGGDPLSSSNMTIVSSWRSPMTPQGGSPEQRLSTRSLDEVERTPRPKTHGHKTTRESDTKASMAIPSYASDSTIRDGNKVNRPTDRSSNNCGRDDGTPVATDTSDHAIRSASGTGE